MKSQARVCMREVAPLRKIELSRCVRVDFQCRVVFTCVKFTLANKIEAIHVGSLVSVKGEPRSTSRLSSELFILPLFYLRD